MDDACRIFGSGKGQTVVLGKTVNLAMTASFRRKGRDAQHRGDVLPGSKAIPLDPPSQAKGEDVRTTPFGTKGVARSAGGWGCHGFTLVELMITLAVGAILLMIAVPSFHNLILSNRLTMSANALVNALNDARLDAIKLNADTQFCGSAGNGGDTLGTACSGASAGAIYSLPQSGATAMVRVAPPGLTSPIQLTGAGMAAVRFSGRGFGYSPATPGTPYNNPVAVVCTPGLSSNNQRIISMTTGSIVAVATSTGGCP